MSAAWFNNPNAPRISHQIYSAEKSNFAGVLVGAILHGMQNYVSIYLHPSHLLVYCSRNRHRLVLPVHDCAARPNKSHEERQHVVACSPHCRLVFCCDDGSCNGLFSSPCSVHQGPGVSRRVFWTFLIFGAPQVRCGRKYFRFCYPGEPVASRWSLGESQLNSATRVLNLSYFHSCIAAMSFMV